MTIPRPEYPRPQFVRDQWLCLNGEWQFEIDAGDSGIERGLRERELKGRILLPFCPESELSGVHHTDHMNAVWYRRTVEIPKAWEEQRVLLHFQAVDYDATVWVNGKEVGRHRGGFTTFTCDLAGVAAPGETATIVVRARDDSRRSQPAGKQAHTYAPSGVLYTRTTGIWQTVWMEPVPDAHLRRPRITPDVANGAIRVEQPLSVNGRGMHVRATLRDAQGVVCAATSRADLDFAPRLDLDIPESRRRLWSSRDPHLYALDIELVGADGTVVDRASSYAGLRSVAIEGAAVKINGEAIFQRLVPDQGYYPDGVMTAPSEEALVRDIELGMEAGFNGARLHQKVFEERFLYHADRMGYLVWGEFGDWGANGYLGIGWDGSVAAITYAAQWLEALQRDYSHPSIIGWCGTNESSRRHTDEILPHDDAIRAMFLAAKAMDTTRPVIDVSGFCHCVAETDIYDVHDYEQSPEKMRSDYGSMTPCEPVPGNNHQDKSVAWRGQPFMVSEFGGIFWDPEKGEGGGIFGWGAFKGVEALHERFEGLTAALLDNPKMFGYCYTQLTDVHCEPNGIYDFHRRPKFDIARVRKAQLRQAAIETGERS